MTDDNHAAETLQQKIDELTQRSAKKIADICRRYKVPRDAADAMAADVADMYNAHYKGLCATPEQMRIITQNIKPRSWGITENAALGLIPKYYAGILEILDGSGVIGGDYLNAVVYCEAARRQHTTPPETSQEDAQRLYYTFAVYLIAELCDATPEELQQIPYRGKYTTKTTDTGEERHIYKPDVMIYRTAVIARALGIQQQRRRLDAEAARRKAQRKRRTTGDDTRSSAPRLFADEDKTIAIAQNFAYTLGIGLMTADNDESGRHDAFSPLRQQIKRQRRAAEALLKPDSGATEVEQKKATQLITTTNAVWQVLDGLITIPQLLSPDASSDTRTRYDMTPHEFARYCTGTEHPAPEQITAILRATAWLRTQTMQVWETTTKTITARDADGKVLRDEYGKPVRKVVERQICTDFQPLVVEFRSEYEDNVLVEDATRVRLQIHRIITDGRSADYYIDNSSKERLYIKPPVKHVLQLNQFYDVASDEERILRNILLSKPKLAEDKLLTAVFDYTARQHEYDADADEAQNMADTLQQSTTATDEQKQAAQHGAQQARDKAKYYITNHMGDDVKRLKAMFSKAQASGVIAWYSRDEARTTKRKTKYGSGFVWTWERPKAADVKNRGKYRRK